MHIRLQHTFLQPTYYIDSHHPDVIAFAHSNSDVDASDADKAAQLYLAVRDGWRYDPYNLDFRRESMKASSLLLRKGGYCGEKACLLAASARAVGIPARLGFATVKNHIGTEKLEEFLGTDELVFHGFTELLIDGVWVKATPAFNKALCEKLGVAPLEFNGREDSIFQEYDRNGGKFMTYLHDYGTFSDLPRDLFLAELKRNYGHLFEEKNAEKLGMRIVED